MLRMGLSLWKNWIVRKNVNYGLREHLIKIADVAGGAIRQTTFEDQPRVAGITTNKMKARTQMKARTNVRWQQQQQQNHIK